MDYQLISVDETDLYQFGFLQLIDHLIFFLLTCVIGVVTSEIGKISLFLLLFFLLRSVSGGVHLKNSLYCLLFSLLSVLFFILYIKHSISTKILVSTAVVTSIFNFAYPVIDNENNRLSMSEKEVCNRKKKVIVYSYLLLSGIPYFMPIISYVFFLNFLSLSVGMINKVKYINFLLK